jgi:hypothetical protein
MGAINIIYIIILKIERNILINMFLSFFCLFSSGLMCCLSCCLIQEQVIDNTIEDEFK